MGLTSPFFPSPLGVSSQPIRVFSLPIWVFAQPIRVFHLSCPLHIADGSYFSFLSEPSWGLFSAHSGLFSAHLGLCSAHSGLISMQRAPPAAHRRRVGLVRCVGEGRPLHIADGSVSCVPCARVCVMVVHVHDALVEIQSLVRRKPCLVLYLFLTKHFIFISGFIFISFLFIFIHCRYRPV